MNGSGAGVVIGVERVMSLSTDTSMALKMIFSTAASEKFAFLGRKNTYSPSESPISPPVEKTIGAVFV